MKSVCIFIEQKNGVPTSNSQKILFMAQTLKKRYGYMIIVFVLDQDVDIFIPFLNNIEVDIVYYIRINAINPCFLKRDEVHKLALFLNELKTDIIWACNSTAYKTLLPKIAYLLKTGLCSACLDFQYNKALDRIDMIRMAYSENVYAQIAVHRSKPLMATILDDSGTYILKNGTPCSEICDITSEVMFPGINDIAVETIKTIEANSLNTSKVVIGIGNGITKKSDLLIFENLASLFNNAAIGGTRELVNKQIIPQERQIGSTGIQIYADLYIAFGVSGAPQHIQGIEHVKTIIAVNHDPYADIFKYSDYGIVGDLYEVANYIINYMKGKYV